MNKEDMIIYLKLMINDANRIRNSTLSPAQTVAILNDIMNYAALLIDEMDKNK